MSKYFQTKEQLFNSMLATKVAQIRQQTKLTGRYVERVKMIDSILNQLESFHAIGIVPDVHLSLELVEIRNKYKDIIQAEIE